MWGSGRRRFCNAGLGVCKLYIRGGYFESFVRLSAVMSAATAATAHKVSSAFYAELECVGLCGRVLAICMWYMCVCV